MLPAMPVRYHWEDFPVGHVREFGATTVTREAIVDFAGRYDLQPFHLDDAAAERSLFGRSGGRWHTCALAMRMMRRLPAGIGQPGSPG